MLSAHQPLKHYPELIREAARNVGASAAGRGRRAGHVRRRHPGPRRHGAVAVLARRDRAGHRDRAVARDVRRRLLLGVCDKIVPGLLIGALSFGHLPAIFVPAGPMPSGLPNAEKARVRQRYAEGKATREELLEAEAASYHGAGTCTFYGTANSNQMLVESDGPASARQRLRQSRHAAARRADRRGHRTRLRDHRARGETTRRSATRSTRKRSSTRWSAWPRPAARPTTRSTWSRSRAPPASHRLERSRRTRRATPLLARIYPNGKAT
jgi:phosphogluconate dehydratase